MAAQWTLTIDSANPAALAAFWSSALGYVEASPPPGFGSWQEWSRDSACRKTNGKTVPPLRIPTGWDRRSLS
jgi:hypothetical protein